MQILEFDPNDQIVTIWICIFARSLSVYGQVVYRREGERLYRLWGNVEGHGDTFERLLNPDNLPNMIKGAHRIAKDVTLRERGVLQRINVDESAAGFFARNPKLANGLECPFWRLRRRIGGIGGMMGGWH